MGPLSRFIPAGIALILLTGLGLAAGAQEPAPAPRPTADGEAEFYRQKVQPLLARRCYACHSGQAAAPQGGLRLDSRAAWLRGGNSGPAVVPGDPDRSRLIQAVRYPPTGLRMPPDGRLPDAEVASRNRSVRPQYDQDFCPTKAARLRSQCRPLRSFLWYFSCCVVEKREAFG